MRFIGVKTTLVIFSLLLVLLGADVPPSVIIERNYSEKGHYNVEYNGRYTLRTANDAIKLDEDYQKTSAILNLPFLPHSEKYDKPVDITGVTEDIPYNYFSTMELSAKYFYSLLGEGYSVQTYTASSNVIFIELKKIASSAKTVNTANPGVDNVRLLIYDNYLKVYKSNLYTE